MSWVMTRAPNRVSFFGGGTDYPEWFHYNPGVVVSTAIDKYSHIMLRKLPAFHHYKNRIVYSQIETTNWTNLIEHNVIRQALDALDISGVELIHSSCLPGRSGMGSSSSFNVALLHAVAAMNNEYMNNTSLANSCILLEREICEETIGIQDGIASACGGLQAIYFDKDGWRTESLMRDDAFMNDLEDSCLLIYTGQQRTSSDIAKTYVKDFSKLEDKQKSITQIAYEGLEYFRQKDIEKIGRLLQKSWNIKRTLSPNISNTQIDDIHNKAMIEGAYGCKLLGAGGGGFFLIMFDPKIRSRIKSLFDGLVQVDFRIDVEGSKIILKE